ncbi:hypothetical protein C068_00811 [Brucella sp. UK38/05]|nr:hypothetical protein C068_00811 [Brucella sp. UK38/05]ENT10611.1 hypothetical protein C001_01240 [Brucella sp. F5/06]
MPLLSGRTFMKMGRVKIAGFVAALLGSTVMAHAGGFERGSQDFDILFENGNAVEAGGTFVAPQRKLKNIRGSAMEKPLSGPGDRILFRLALIPRPGVRMKQKSMRPRATRFQRFPPNSTSPAILPVRRNIVSPGVSRLMSVPTQFACSPQSSRRFRLMIMV